MARHVDPNLLVWSTPIAERFRFFTIIDEETNATSRIAYDCVEGLWVSPEQASVGSKVSLQPSGTPTPGRRSVQTSTGKNPVGAQKPKPKPERKARRLEVRDSGASKAVRNPKGAQKIQLKPERKADRSFDSSRATSVRLVSVRTGSGKTVQSFRKVQGVQLPSNQAKVTGKGPAEPSRIKSRSSNRRELSERETLHQLSKIGKVIQRPQRDPNIFRSFKVRCDKKGYNPSYLRWYCIGSVSQYRPPFPIGNYLDVQKSYQDQCVKAEMAKHKGISEDDLKSILAKDSNTSWMVCEPHRCKIPRLKPYILEELSYIQPEVTLRFRHLSLNDLIEAQNNTLAFYDHVFFIRENLIGHSKIISIGQKYFLASLVNRDRSIKWFKDYIEVIKRTISSEDSSYDSALQRLKERDIDLYNENFFLSLLSMEPWRVIAETKTRTHFIERVFGALTARSMAKPSRNQEDKAYEDFKRIISRVNPCQLDIGLVKRMSILFGRECVKTSRPKPNPFIKLDLGTTACLEYTHSDGGRTAFFRDRFIPWLKASPSVSEEIKVGSNLICTIPPGIPRFRTVLAPGSESPPDGDFDDPNPNLEVERGIFDLFGWADTCKVGYSPNIGYQLYIYSLSNECTSDIYTDTSGSYPRVHASPVLENGGKTRWITIMSMFDSIVQSMAQNHIQPYLMLHPDVNPIFTKYNLAWQMLNKQPPRDCTYHNSLYVSDYSNATDAIDHRVARALLEGFLEGVGEDPHGSLVLPGIESLCKEKALFHRRDRGKEGIIPTISHSGIFMGEPLTKVTLTIFMHVLPLIALHQSNGRTYVSSDKFNPPPWYFYYAPGDDHVASGPQWFLDSLQSTSDLLGMILNREKTYQSHSFVPLCEQWLYVPNLRNHVTTVEACDNLQSYLRSGWVETLKLKLFSPAAVSEKFHHVEDYSILGRATSLATCLRKLVPTWSNQERENFRDYFIHRYIDQLPPRNWWQYHFVFLKTQVGGLGLSISDGEELRHWNLIPSSLRRSMVSFFVSDASELWEKLPCICMPKAVYGYDVSALEDAVTTLAHTYELSKADKSCNPKETRSLREIKESLKGLLFDFAISTEKLKVHRRGTSQRYETRLRNCFASTCDLRDIRGNDIGGDFLLVATEEEKLRIPELFGIPPSSYEVETLDSYLKATREYQPHTNPLPHYKLVCEAEKYLPRYRVPDDLYSRLRRCSVFLGVPSEALQRLPV
uniref:RNA-dependent RNA polymerase n=1 Tax=Obscuromonas narnavirus 1 TaxID=3157914 RepID=A0AAU7BNR5_9VIRU